MLQHFTGMFCDFFRDKKTMHLTLFIDCMYYVLNINIYRSCIQMYIITNKTDKHKNSFCHSLLTHYKMVALLYIILTNYSGKLKLKRGTLKYN